MVSVAQRVYLAVMLRFEDVSLFVKSCLSQHFGFRSVRVCIIACFAHVYRNRIRKQPFHMRCLFKVMVFVKQNTSCHLDSSFCVLSSIVVAC